MTGSTAGSLRVDRRIGYALLALLAYVPPLLTASGNVAADTKQYLYLDPDRMLGRAVSMWDPNIGLGTVTHQNIGYLFPMGPFYWVFEHLGVPDWIAQRLWLGTILFAAGVGMLYLFRTLGVRGPGAVVGSLAFMLSPYSLDYAARISVILLPWAALPWMLALVIRALREDAEPGASPWRGGWLYPAVFAIVVQVVGGVNATALVFAGLAPVLWIPYAVFVSREIPLRRAIATTVKIGALVIGTSLWWIAGLWAQGGYGLNVLKYTETIETVAKTSLVPEVLRGLGYWFFYGRDKLGPWIEASVTYTQNPGLIVLSFVIPTLALLAAAVVRWRHRVYFIGLILVGVIIAVGSHPYDDPSPLGSLFKSLAGRSTVALALRSTGRAVPLVVLGLAVLLAVGVSAASRRIAETSWSLRAPAWRPLVLPVVIGALLLLNLPALWNDSFYGKNLQRPEDVPDYWTDAIAQVDGGDHDTRILEVPGSDFASYRWGNTVDPITPGLTDRPYVARELIPWGAPATADLLNAYDRQFQEGVMSDEAIVPVAQLMSVGDLLARLDIQNDRYNLVRPSKLWGLLDGGVSGLGAPTTYGPPLTTDGAVYPLVDEQALASAPDEAVPPSLAVFPVEDTLPIVRSKTGDDALVVAGDGEGLVNAAAQGLLDPRQLVLYSASFGDPDELRAAVGEDSVLVVTDSNRRRARRWSTVRDNTGYTESAGEEPLVEDPADERLEVFPDAGDDAFTVTEQRGVESVQASDYGNPVAYNPEDRAARAIDGDLYSAWKVGAFSAVDGERIRIELEEPITTDQVNLVQPLFGPRERYITEATLTFDGSDSMSVDLDDSSRTDAGQTVTFDSRTFDTLEIEIDDTNISARVDYRGASAVGFSEIRLHDEGASEDITVDEITRMPTDLLDALGDESADHPLVLTMTRERVLPVPPRYDPELALVREFELPTERIFELRGEARIDPVASDETLEVLLGRPEADEGGVTSRSSLRLPGDVGSLPSAAIDGDPGTAWNTSFGFVEDQWVEYELPEPITFDRMDLEVIADGRHSVPTQVTVTAGGESRTVAVPPIEDRPEDNARVTASLDFEPLTGRNVRVTVDTVRPLMTLEYFGERDVVAPVAIAELNIPGLEAAERPNRFDDACRDDLLTIDGEPVPIRIVGDMESAVFKRALTVEPCDGPITLDAGVHELRAAEGIDTGIDLDELVLESRPGGDDQEPAFAERAAPPTVDVVEDGRTTKTVQVEGATEPFWLVLGESLNEGWQATIDGESLGDPQLVDGFANGWQIDPASESFEVTLEWVPQRTVNVALILSAIAFLACAVLVIVSLLRRRRGAPTATSPDHEPVLVSPFADVGPVASWPVTVMAALGTGAVAAILVRPWTGPVVALAIGVVLRVPRWRFVLRLAPAAILLLCGLAIAAGQVIGTVPPTFEWPTAFEPVHLFGWLAVIFLAGDALVEVIQSRTRPGAGSESALADDGEAVADGEDHALDP